MIASKPHSPPVTSSTHPGLRASPPVPPFGPHHRSASDPARPRPQLARGGSGEAVEAVDLGRSAGPSPVQGDNGPGVDQATAGRSEKADGARDAEDSRAQAGGGVRSGAPGLGAKSVQPGVGQARKNQPPNQRNRPPNHQQVHPHYPHRTPDVLHHQPGYPQQPPPILGLPYPPAPQPGYGGYPSPGAPPVHQAGHPWPSQGGPAAYPSQHGPYQQHLFPHGPTPFDRSGHSPAVSPAASTNPSPYHPTIALPTTPVHLAPEWAQFGTPSQAPSPIGGQTVYGDDGLPLVEPQSVPEYAHGQPSAYTSPPPSSELYSPVQSFGSQEWYALAQMQTQPPGWQGPGPAGYSPAVSGYGYGSPALAQAGYYPPSPSAAFPAHSRVDSGFGSQFTSPEMGSQPFAGGFGGQQFGTHSRGPSARGYAPQPQHRGPRPQQPPYPQRGPGPAPPHPQPPHASGADPSAPRSAQLARGQLAQAKLHGALAQAPHAGGQGQGRKREVSGVSGKGGLGGRTAALPRPPSHSPHALWVGNVPSDSTTEELEVFFMGRSPPAASPEYHPRPEGLPEALDLESQGVESVHLIAR